MCKTWSCIVSKEKTVYSHELSDSHEDIISKHNLKERSDSDLIQDWARVEICPKEGNDIFSDIETWALNVDESIKPIWWSEEHEQVARYALKGFACASIHNNKKIDSLNNGRHWLNSSVVERMDGSSVVERMYSSVVKCMDGSSVVERMDGNAIIIDQKNSKIIVT